MHFICVFFFSTHIYLSKFIINIYNILSFYKIQKKIESKINLKKNKKNIYIFFNIYKNNFYMVTREQAKGQRHHIPPVCNISCLNLC